MKASSALKVETRTAFHIGKEEILDREFNTLFVPVVGIILKSLINCVTTWSSFLALNLVLGTL